MTIRTHFYRILVLLGLAAIGAAQLARPVRAKTCSYWDAPASVASP